MGHIALEYKPPLFRQDMHRMASGDLTIGKAAP